MFNLCQGIDYSRMAILVDYPALIGLLSAVRAGRIFCKDIV